LIKTFIKTGTIPEYNYNEEINFRKYTREEKYGSIPLIPAGSIIIKKKEENSILDDNLVKDVTVDDAINFFDEEEDCDDINENEDNTDDFDL
jgi:hypothetical protein